MVCLLTFLTGYFEPFIVFTLLLIIHECGHILMCFYYHWEIKQIILLPFGGITKVKTDLNTPLKQELLVCLMGPIFQIFGYFLLLIFFPKGMLSNIHYSLLIFNLLPIFPLDGSKILRTVLEYFISFKRSHILILSFSWITILLLWVRFPTLLIFMILIFLCFENIRDLKKHTYYVELFLLERYMKRYPYRKIIKIHHILQMRKGVYHYIQSSQGYQSEKKILTQLFGR